MGGPLIATRLPPQPCPNCGYKMDAATPTANEFIQPTPQDVSVCLNCEQLLQFDDNMILRKIRFDDLPDDIKPEIVKLIFTMRKLLPTLKAQRN